MPKVINFFCYWYRISFHFLALLSSVYWRVTLKWGRHLFQSKNTCSSLFPGTQELFSRTVETAKIRSETVLFYQNLKFVNVFDLLICFDLRNTWLLFTVPYVKKEILIIQFIHILGWKFVIKLAARMVWCVKNHSVVSGNKKGSQQNSRMFKDISITDYSGNQYHTKTWMLAWEKHSIRRVR